MTPQPHIGQRISAQFEQLSQQERRVAAFILDHFEDLAVYTATDLARLTRVSKSTVTRLFQRLGFENYQAVRRHARELRALGIPLATEGGSSATPLELFRRHQQREQDNLERCLAEIAPETFAEIVTVLDRSRHIVVIGFRNSYPIALHCRQQLIQVRGGVQLAPLPNQSLSDELVGLNEDDLVIVLGFRRRPRVFDGLMAWLAERPMKVLLMADSAFPGMEAADWQLSCGLDSTSAFDSYAVPMSLVCLLANSVLHQRMAEGRQRIDVLADTYEVLDELSI